MSAAADEDIRRRRPTVVGDPDLLRLVMTNLLGNAVKFTFGRAGGRVEVISEFGKNAVTVRVRDKHRPGRARLSFARRGCWSRTPKRSHPSIRYTYTFTRILSLHLHGTQPITAVRCVQFSMSPVTGDALTPTPCPLLLSCRNFHEAS
jgi:hypothetical protein